MHEASPTLDPAAPEPSLDERPATADEGPREPPPAPDGFWLRARRDPLLAIAVVGAVLASLGTLNIQSSLNQPFGDFVAKNSGALWLAGAGIALFLLGCLGRAAALTPPENGASTGAPRRDRKRGPIWVCRAAGAAMLLCAASIYGFVIQQAMGPAKGMAQVAAFGAAIVLLVAGASLLEAGRARSWARDLGLGRWQAALPWRRRDAPYLAAYLLIWFLLMLWRLDARPGFFHGDEATVTMYGRSTRYFEDSARNQSPWMTLYAPYMAGVPRSIMQDMFRWKSPYFGPRLCTLLISTCALAILFVLARAYLGRAAAWIALALASTQHVMLAFSRMGILSMDGILLLCGFALAWLGMMRSRRASLGALAGVCAGLAVYTYHGALLAFPLAGTALLLQFMRFPKALAVRWRALAAFALAAVAVAAPMRVYLRQDPNRMTIRSDMVSMTSQSKIEALFKQTKAGTLEKAFLARCWPAYGGVLLWNDTSSNYAYRGLPSLDRPTLALFLLGLAGAAAQWRRRRAVELLALWAVLALTFGSLLTDSPPPPYIPRSMMSFPAVFMLAGWVLAGLAARAGRLAGRWAWIAMMALSALGAGAIGANNVRHYRFIYAEDLTHPNYRNIMMGFMDFLRTFPRDAHIVCFSDHALQLSISRHAMFDKGQSKQMIVDRNAAIPPAMPRRLSAYVFKVPEFAEAEKRFLSQYPEGRPIEIFNPRIKAPATHHVYWVQGPG